MSEKDKILNKLKEYFNDKNDNTPLNKIYQSPPRFRDTSSSIKEMRDEKEGKEEEEKAEEAVEEEAEGECIKMKIVLEIIYVLIKDVFRISRT